MAMAVATLSDSDIERLFSGAPHYCARSEGHFTGAPHPSVAFPYDEELEIRDLTDHVQIEDPAWGCMTAWPHITRATAFQPSISPLGESAHRPSCGSHASGLSIDTSRVTSPVVSSSESKSQPSSQSSLARSPVTDTQPGTPLSPSPRSHFNPRCRERPSMLSMQGLERGTMGFQAALQLAVADALQERQFGFETLFPRARAVVDARRRLLASKDMVRRLEEAEILALLARAETRYHESRVRQCKAMAWYEDLFAYVLCPPSRVVDHNDPFGLPMQIQHLLCVLTTAKIWIDFSHPDWRVRLGQILWYRIPEVGSTPVATVVPESSTPPPMASALARCPEGFTNPTRASDDIESLESVSKESPILHYDLNRGGGGAAAVSPALDWPNDQADLAEERYWLLLQILLACELLVRLDAITKGEEFGLEKIKQSEVLRFERDANTPLKWSLILARTWLDNVEVTSGPSSSSPAESTATGWLASLAEKITLHQSSPYSYHDTGSRGHPNRTSALFSYSIRGRHGQRQVHGLTNFAQRIGWPGIDTAEGRIADHCHCVNAAQQCAAEPLDQPPPPTPISHAATDTSWTSFFGSIASAQHRHHHRRPSQPSPPPSPHPPQGRHSASTSDRVLAATLHPSGWLTRTYLSGLILPGEGLSHFLMATLLENDDVALARLGPIANLRGGVVYAGRSFWSVACVVGRVLAAAAGSNECVGWIGSDVVPRGVGEGWVDIDVQPLPDEGQSTGRRARLWDKRTVERASHILGTIACPDVLPTDFFVPLEGAQAYAAPPASLSVALRALSLDPVPGAGPALSSSTAAPLRTYAATVAFTVSTAATPLFLSLRYDVRFVSAHPCEPSHRVRLVRSQSSTPASPAAVHESPDPPLAGHALHRSYACSTVPLATVLAHPTGSLDSLTRTAAAVLIVDCVTAITSHGAAGRPRSLGCDADMAARAWCAERGWNAVVSKRRRDCVGCAVREAGALGWRVVLRVE